MQSNHKKHTLLSVYQYLWSQNIEKGRTYNVLNLKKEILSTSSEVNKQWICKSEEKSQKDHRVVFLIQAILADGTKVSSVFNLMASQHPARPPNAPTTAHTWAGTDPTSRHKTQRPMTAQHDPECPQEIPVMPQKAHEYVCARKYIHIYAYIYTTHLIT